MRWRAGTLAGGAAEGKGRASSGAIGAAGAGDLELKSASRLLQQQPRKSACERVMKEGLSPRKPRKKQAGRRCAGLHWGFRQLVCETLQAGGRVQAA